MSEEVKKLTDEELSKLFAETVLGWRVFRPSEVKKWHSVYDAESYAGNNHLHYFDNKNKRPQTHMIDAKPLPNFCADMRELFPIIEHYRQQWFEANPHETEFFKFTDCCEYGWLVEICWGHHDGDVPLHTAVNRSLPRAICELIYEYQKNR